MGDLDDSAPGFEIPDIDDIERAAARIRDVAIRTPLLESPLLNDRLGGRLLVKAEPLQRTGSFKIRGAFNRLSALGPDARRRGVVAFSSGNHAQGVAASAKLLDIPATIVMPKDAPAIKISNTKAYGARVVTYDRASEDRQAIADAIVRRDGATLVPPFEDPYIIAGQGTTGVEIADQARDIHASVDAVLVPCGGGGLSAGIAIAIAARLPATKLRTVEPRGYDDTARSLAVGHRVENEYRTAGLCDAIANPTPGATTYCILHDHGATGLVVDDSDVLAAMAAAFRHFKLVVEPGGAVALAAVLSGVFALDGRTAIVVASGGNVEADVFEMAIRQKSGDAT